MSPLLLLLGLARAAPPPPDQAVWVAVPDAASRETLQQLGLGWDEGSRPGWLRMRVEESQLEALARSELRWEPVAAAAAPVGYPALDELMDRLELLAVANPELVSRVQVGTSEAGRPLEALRITAAEQPLGHQRILGAHHGDEPVSATVALDAAEALVAAWGKDPELTALLSEEAVWVLPVVNPDGYLANTRSNATGVDLNRNYGFAWSEDAYRSGESAFSEAETRGVRALATWTGFGAGLSLHSGAANIGWVWNYTTEPSPDATLLEALAARYAESCGAERFWITNGADWYVTQGDTTDWSYGAMGTLDYTLELSEVKAPSAELLPELSEHHWPAIRSFLLWPDKVQLQVVDADTGAPLPAQVQVASSWPAWTGPEGRWSRPVSADGAVTVEVSSPGWDTRTLSLEAGTPVQIALQRGPLPSHRPEPALLSRTGDGRFELEDAASLVVLRRAGEEPVAASWDGEAWGVELSLLSAGPWDLEVDGEASPRALFIGEHDARVALSDVRLLDGLLVVEGAGFGPGSQAWMLWGSARLPLSLELASFTEELLVFDASPLEELEDLDQAPLDMVLLSAGHQLAALDLMGELRVDTGAPHDTGLTIDTGTTGGADGQDSPDAPTSTDGATACGCSTPSPAGYPPPLLPLIALVGAMWRRRSV